jgi:hypothetical protein
MTRALLQQAYKLQMDVQEGHVDLNELLDSITAIREYLAQPEQEPVAWWQKGEYYEFVSGAENPNGKLDGVWVPLYLQPKGEE